jgi:tetratricopeptide (TPR) repeat protein
MRRYLLLGILGGLVVLVSFVAVLALILQSIPQDRDAETASAHSDQGIALMRQHLYHAAIEEFEAATRQSPNALDPWVGLAAVYIRLGNAPKALEGAGKAVGLAEDSPDVQLVFGRAQWLARNFSDAEKAALKVEELQPANPHAAELLLHIYFDRNDDAKFQEVLNRLETPNRAIQDLAIQFAIRRGEFRRAYELWNSFERRTLDTDILRAELALKREPGQTEIYLPLVRNLIRVGRSDDALAAADASGGTVPLHLEIAKAWWLAGNNESALRAYRRASEGRTHKMSAEVALAAITGELSHWREAFKAEWFEKDYFVLAQLEDLLKTSDPLQKALIYRYAGLYDKQLFNDAAREARTALDAEPENFEALMTLGTAYARVDRIEDALRYIQQAADRFPDRAEVWSRLGQYELQKGDVDSAEASLAKAVRMEPSNASYLYNYAWLLDQSDRKAEAVPYYERAIAQSSLSFEALNNLALIEAAAGNRDRGLSLLTRAVLSNPENEIAYFNRGNYYADLRSWKNALTDYARASELNPLNALAYVESARIHMELERVDIALEELSAALDIDPRVPDGYVLLSAAYAQQGKKVEAAAALNESKRIRELH